MTLFEILLVVAIAAVIYGIVSHKIDLSKLEERLKAHFTTASTTPPVDHVGVIQAAASVVSAAKPSTLAKPDPVPAGFPFAPGAPRAPSGNPFNLPDVQPPSVTFDPAKYPTQPERMHAVQLLVAAVTAKYGNSITRIVAPSGNDVDTRGDEMKPQTVVTNGSTTADPNAQNDANYASWCDPFGPKNGAPQRVIDRWTKEHGG